MKKRLLIFIQSLILIALLASCSITAIPVNMSGTWSATFTNRANLDKEATFTLRVTDTGSSLSGSAYIGGIYAGSIRGTRSGGNFEFRLPISGVGTFQVEGKTTSTDRFTGSYTANGGGYGPVSGSR